MKNVEKDIKIITHHLFSIKEEQIHRESRLREDLGLDSLDAMEWIVELETHFTISIPDEDALSFKEVGQVISYIEQHAAEYSFERSYVSQHAL
jgi:acyl carrier protein